MERMTAAGRVLTVFALVASSAGLVPPGACLMKPCHAERRHACCETGLSAAPSTCCGRQAPSTPAAARFAAAAAALNPQGPPPAALPCLAVVAVPDAAFDRAHSPPRSPILRV